MRANSKAPVSLLIAIAAVTLAAFAMPAAAVDFSAEIYTTSRDSASSDQLYVSGDKYCIVQSPLHGRGGTTTVLVDRVEGITTVMLDSRKEYNFMPSDAGQSVMNDPFQAIEHAKTILKIKPLGKETVNGYECDKRVYMQDTTELIVEWFSPKLNFSVKTQSLRYGVNERAMELRYIQEGPQDPGHFRIPTGYARYQGQPLRLPEWEMHVARAPLGEMPYYGDLKMGELVRLKIEPGKTIMIQANTPDNKPSDASAVPFKDGKPVGDVSAFRLYNIRGDIWLPLANTNAEADEIVVGSNSSDIKVEAHYIDQPEKVLAAGEEFIVPLVRAEKTDLRAVNLSDAASRYQWTYMVNGEPLSDAKTKPARFRQWILHDPVEVDARPIPVYGDAIKIKVTEGKVLLKVSQYDPSLFKH